MEDGKTLIMEITVIPYKSKAPGQRINSLAPGEYVCEITKPPEVHNGCNKAYVIVTTPVACPSLITLRMLKGSCWYNYSAVDALVTDVKPVKVKSMVLEEI